MIIWIVHHTYHPHCIHVLYQEFPHAPITIIPSIQKVYPVFGITRTRHYRLSKYKFLCNVIFSNLKVASLLNHPSACLSRFVNVDFDRLDLIVVFESIFTIFTSNTTLLIATKWCIDFNNVIAVNP